MQALAILLLLTVAASPSWAKKKTSDLQEYANTLEGQTFRLKIAVLKLSIPMADDTHPTNIYPDGSVAYRAQTGDIFPTSKDLVQHFTEGRNHIINTAPQPFLEEARTINPKISGQLVGAGTPVKIKKVVLEEKYVRISIETQSEIVARVYLQFKKKSYNADDFEQLFGFAFEPVEVEKPASE